ncbi:hypothetical protein P6144_00200 [Sphingomonas sp. HITSZ_GF]|uniref:hypothetical protein n=1 Tax=Sphingomonas sp. HITSZ_GF TaxID=3037247 RepID=UPI00240E6169|nr:hypothetical protein [Sphingomonas sp. HITSZ_GF]MDG2532056.1 hypothetical protein [Sphingomonas sp. HITSZ_GF]
MIAYSTLRDVYDRYPVMHLAQDWTTFADYLEGQSAQCGRDKTRTLCISPAIYDDGVIRAKRNVAGWNWFAADIDDKGGDIRPTIDAIAEKMIEQGSPFVVYTTSSHTSRAHRFRLMFPLSRIVEAEEYPAMWATIAQWLGCLDPQTKDESRLFVAPRAWNEETIFHRCDEGDPLDIDLMMLLHPVTIAPRPSRKLTSAYMDLSGFRTPSPDQISLHGDLVAPESLAKACSGEKGGRLFAFLCSTGTRALLKGYAITADDLAAIGREYAHSIGRDTSDIDHDAQNAHAAAVSRYAEIKATRMERIDPLAEKFAKWRRNAQH